MKMEYVHQGWFRCRAAGIVFDVIEEQRDLWTVQTWPQGQLIGRCSTVEEVQSTVLRHLQQNLAAVVN